MPPKKTDESRLNQETGPCTCESGSGCTVEAILTIDERGQMVLPKDMREKAGIGPGDKLALISWERDGKICCLALMKTEPLSGLVKDILGPVLQQGA
jgi:looped-hinge helix DNA binding domain, AbrB family